MKTFIISDTHFFHYNIIKYCNRPFDNTEQMNEYMIKQWNRVVSKGDQIFMLGDFALCGKDKLIEIGKRLNGQKILILGNHDGASYDTYHEAGFKSVVKYPIIYNDYFILSHYPQFVAPNSIYVNIFGHIHINPNYKDVSENGFCCSAERLNYTPIEFDEIVKRIEKERNNN